MPSTINKTANFLIVSLFHFFSTEINKIDTFKFYLSLHKKWSDFLHVVLQDRG